MPLDSEARKYVKSELAEGRSDDQIRDKLTEQGWSAADVDAAIAEAKTPHSLPLLLGSFLASLFLLAAPMGASFALSLFFAIFCVLMFLFYFVLYHKTGRPVQLRFFALTLLADAIYLAFRPPNFYDGMGAFLGFFGLFTVFSAIPVAVVFYAVRDTGKRKLLLGAGSGLVLVWIFLSAPNQTYAFPALILLPVCFWLLFAEKISRETLKKALVAVALLAALFVGSSLYLVYLGGEPYPYAVQGSDPLHIVLAYSYLSVAQALGLEQALESARSEADCDAMPRAFRPICYNVVALLTKNAALCDKAYECAGLQGERQTQCLRSLTLCKQDVLIRLAVDNKDISYCKNNQACINNAAIELRDYVLCDQLSDQNLKENCIYNIAVRLKDSALCETLPANSTRRDDCFTGVEQRSG